MSFYIVYGYVKELYDKVLFTAGKRIIWLVGDVKSNISRDEGIRG